jgi:putative transcriptional regulator
MCNVLISIVDVLYAITYFSEMKLVNHIKQHRARLDLTQQDLAERVGVRRQAILAIEKGKYVPSAMLAFRLARALGMTVTELFELETGNESLNEGKEE